jgi:hypothetical protein
MSHDYEGSPDDFFAPDPDDDEDPIPDDKGHTEQEEWDPFSDEAPDDEMLEDGQDDRRFVPSYFPY